MPQDSVYHITPRGSRGSELRAAASATPTLRGEEEVVEIPMNEKLSIPGHNQSKNDVSSEITHTQTESRGVPGDDNGELASKGEKDGVWIVEWDGPDDPQNPKNWTYKQKWAATAIVSAFTFISPVSSSMIAPASDALAKDFGITNSSVIALTTSVFVLAYAWNLGCGFAQNKGQLIAFRFLSGLGGSAPLSIGGGVLGDCWKTEERGAAIALYSLAPLLGPVVGPVAGAWVAEKSTWRWVFWSTTIVDGIIQLFGLVFLRETFAPILLERKAEAIRQTLSKESDTEKGKAPQLVRTPFDEADRHWKSIVSKALVRPFKLFYYEPIVQVLGLYMAFIYGLLYLFLTTMPSIFEGVYQQRVGIAGLHYIALGVGLTGASQINARFMDKIYIALKKRNGGKGAPEFRLPPMVPGTILLPIGLFLTGWTARASIHWIVPDIGIALVGAGTILNFQCIQTYVIDAFTLHAASALAAVAFLRSLAGFGFPLFAPSMYNALGYGKGDTILAVVAIVIGCPAPWVFWKYGERIRKASRHARNH
ncbi:hypothetical protein NLI96_g9543 [Meripilus lineatus]|uniref:Major facilitator superfamily (MFS) profile domain-containing protein n=1 Tax=Meripilus lineatus TaxID=2056292 RepID=A0AAD5UVI4_9APHY|nr:hypothetical protein NLI96_g9543 [Physisporinus lineatus]